MFLGNQRPHIWVTGRIVFGVWVQVPVLPFTGCVVVTTHSLSFFTCQMGIMVVSLQRMLGGVCEGFPPQSFF